MFEPVTLIAGLQYVAVMREPVEQRCRHLLVAKHARPLAEAQVGCNHNAGALIEFADQVEEQSAAGLAER